MMKQYLSLQGRVKKGPDQQWCYLVQSTSTVFENDRLINQDPYAKATAQHEPEQDVPFSESQPVDRFSPSYLKWTLRHASTISV
jgi:hypothetical protein